MSSVKHTYDLAILGNGIAGMTAAVYAKRAGLDFIIIGQDTDLHGQIDNAISIENYLGLPFISGFELGNMFSDHLTKLDIDVTEDEIISVHKCIDENYSYPIFKIVCEYNKTYYAKSIIYALGCTHKHLNTNIIGNVKIHYCATCDGYLYKDKDVAVIGGGNSAFTEALYLSKICKQVAIVMCDSNITADRIEVERVENTDNITIIKDFPISDIKNESGKCIEIICANRDKSIMFDGVFVAIGMRPSNVALEVYDLMMYNEEFIFGDETGATSSKGFFVAGDIRSKKLRQCVTASADGANAVVSVIDYLNSIKEN